MPTFFWNQCLWHIGGYGHHGRSSAWQFNWKLWRLFRHYMGQPGTAAKKDKQIRRATNENRALTRTTNTTLTYEIDRWCDLWQLGGHASHFWMWWYLQSISCASNPMLGCLHVTWQILMWRRRVLVCHSFLPNVWLKIMKMALPKARGKWWNWRPWEAAEGVSANTSKEVLTGIFWAKRTSLVPSTSLSYSVSKYFSFDSTKSFFIFLYVYGYPPMIYLELFCMEKHLIKCIFWETKFWFPTTGSTKKTFPKITENTGKKTTISIVIINKCSKTRASLGFLAFPRKFQNS